MVAIIVLGSLFAAGVLNPAAPEKLTVQAAFNDYDQPVFTINNTGPVDVSISQISAQKAGSNLTAYATQLSSNFIPKKSTVNITATFQVTFQAGTLYNFTILSTKGGSFPASATTGYTFVSPLVITDATINTSTGAVAFSLENTGPNDVVIAYANVTGGSFNNTAGTISSSSTSPCAVASGQATIPKGASCTMKATFGTGFVSGTTYTFILASTTGHQFPYAKTA